MLPFFNQKELVVCSNQSQYQKYTSLLELVLRFIHCLMAMARCSVLTVHIQSAVHPIVL